MDDNHEYDVIMHFPLLSVSDDLKKWTGFISTTLGKTILLSLIVPEFPYVSGIQLSTDDMNEESVKYWLPLVKQISNSAIESMKLLQYLELLNEQVHHGQTSMSASMDGEGGVDNAELYAAVIEEIEHIGVQNVASLSSDFKTIEIKHLDRSKREHCMKVSIPGGYPKEKPVICAELPFPKDSLTWPERIKDIYKYFTNQVEKCSNFWDDMEDLDCTVRVVDPIQPNKGHFHRRILLEDNVILHLVVDPLAPRALPQISFAGPDKHVESLNAAIDQGCNDWDESIRILQNLKSILSCEFVMKESGHDDENNQEEMAPCTVCYVYNFEDEIPEISCDCGATYHRQCIFDLFVSDVSKTVLRRCVECPNCQMDIRVPAGLAAATW